MVVDKVVMVVLTVVLMVMVVVMVVPKCRIHWYYVFIHLSFWALLHSFLILHI